MKSILQIKTIAFSKLLLSLLVLAGFGMQAQTISYASAGSNYTQNFDNLYGTVPANNTTVAATTLPNGWSFVEAGTNANTTLRNDNGSSGTGDTYLDGATNSNERAIGSYASGSLTSQYGATFTNNTGVTLTQFTLTYTGEQWKDGGSAASILNTLSFAYAINPASLTSGTYTNVTNLDFTAVVNNISSDVTTDGNAANRRTGKTFTVTGISWPAGQTLCIRWTDINEVGNDDELAVDDLTFSAVGAATPLITATGTLAAVNTTYGTASATTTFTASGTNLTNDIVITAPSGYELSKTAGGATGYANSQTLTQSSGTVAATTIYARLAATTVFGSYSGNITLVSSPATTINVATVSSSVAKKGLTVSNAVANDKIYDRTTSATILGATAVGTVNSDVIVINGGGTFADYNVGNGITVTPALTFSGTNSGSYTLTQPGLLSANITAKDLTLSGASANNKAYDGNTDAVITGTLLGVIAPDDVAISLTASFDSASADNGIPVTSTSFLFGANITNYNLVQPSGLTANITQKPLTIGLATAQNKVFDGNTDAVINGTLTGVVAPDDVTLIGTGIFASSAVGVNIPVTSTCSIIGDIANYTLVQPTGLAANISAGALSPQTINFNPLSDVVYGSSPFDPGATASSGLQVTYFSSNTDIATVSGNLITIVGVGSVTITASQSGDLTYDTAPTVDQNLNVTPKELTVSSGVAANKVYDGNDATTIAGNLVGIVGGDIVSLNGIGSFSSTNVGNGISVASFSTLTGADAGNYTLAQPDGLVADISTKTLTVTNAVANNKVYDGTTTATISGAVLSGVVGGDTVSAIGNGTFVSKDVANGITVIASITLGGSEASNYSVSQPTGLSANITPLPITVTGITGVNKVYDKTKNATLSGTAMPSIVIGTDNVSVSGTPTALFVSKTVGIAKPMTVTGYTLGGLQAANYMLSDPTNITADVTPAFLTISGAVAQNKPFDGTTAATITGTLVGVIAGDVVNLIGSGTFASAAIGTGIGVTSTSTLSGGDGNNYLINPQPTGLSANITVAATVFSVGDLSIIGFNVNSPDSFAFVTWVNITNGTTIKFTDNAFLTSGSANLANNARGGENFVIWKNNGGTIPAGTVITIQDNTSAAGTNNGTIVTGNLSGLSASGDNIFAYQGAALTGTAPDFANNNNPTTFNGTVLFGLYTQGSSSFATWIATGIASSNNSYLPSELNVANGSIALGSSASRGQYTGSRSNQVSLVGYKSLVTNPGNWTIGAGAGVAVLNTTSFTLATGPTASLLSGTTSICLGGSANINALVTGGLSPYTVVYTNGISNFTVNNYVSGSNIVVSPTANTTYTLVSVTDANALAGTGNSGSAVVTVNIPVTYYADADGDGYGNATLTTSTCGSAPLGFVANNTDCTDTKSTVHPGAVEIGYNLIDDDCDGSIDEGFPPKTTIIQGVQCNTTLSTIDTQIFANLVAGAQGYRWRITTMSGPNAGQVQFLDTALRVMKLTQLTTYAFNTQYKIEVAVYYSGSLQPYTASNCTVSTPVTTTQLVACGQTLVSTADVIYADMVPFASGYKFRITDPLNPSFTQEIERPLREFRMNLITSFVVRFGKTYNVSVAIKNTDGSYLAYGNICNVTTPLFPTTSLQDAQCDNYMVPTNNTPIYANSYPGAIRYAFQLSGTTLAEPVEVVKILSTFSLGDFTGLTPGATYNVKVRMIFNMTDAPGPYGKTCSIVAPGLSRQTVDSEIHSDFNAVAYPNPFSESFSIDLTASSSKEIVNLKIYDMTGRLLENRNIKADEMKSLKAGENYPSGVYNVMVSQGENIKMLRLVKR